jgi:AcrR family transcriptional regulator
VTTETVTPSIREQAIALRLAGKSRREIKEILGPVSNRILDDALRGTPPAEWTRRPSAKDDLRQTARKLRTEELSVNEIAARLGVSKSSVSVWVRDLPYPAKFSHVHNPRRHEGLRQYAARTKAARETQLTAEARAAAAEIGQLSERELLIAGAIAYWCEGAKNKPGRKYDHVAFINSDPGLISLFLRFLDVVGVDTHGQVLRIYIHENADAVAAQRFWMDVTGARPEQFRSPTLKHHHPKTRRTNTGADYHGCLRIDVRLSATLYRKIEGWVSAITGQMLSAAQESPVS